MRNGQEATRGRARARARARSRERHAGGGVRRRQERVRGQFLAGVPDVHNAIRLLVNVNAPGPAPGL